MSTILSRLEKIAFDPLGIGQATDGARKMRELSSGPRYMGLHTNVPSSELKVRMQEQKAMGDILNPRLAATVGATVGGLSGGTPQHRAMKALAGGLGSAAGAYVGNALGVGMTRDPMERLIAEKERKEALEAAEAEKGASVNWEDLSESDARRARLDQLLKR